MISVMKRKEEGGDGSALWVRSGLGGGNSMHKEQCIGPALSGCFSFFQCLYVCVCVFQQDPPLCKSGEKWSLNGWRHLVEKQSSSGSEA